MQNNLIRQLSFDVFSELLNVEGVILEGNEIETISGQARLPQLRYLNMDNNRLQFFPENFFAYFSSLQYLRMAGNQLLKIPGHLPKTLQHLRLERNHIKNVKIRDIKHLDNLSELNLSGNQLSTADSVQVLSNLSSFDISKNQIQFLPHRFPTKLQRLDCSNNQISRLTVLNFKNLQSLKHLFLDNNIVSRIDDNSFHWCVHLSNLAMEQNLLTSLPLGLPVTLTRLDLKGNKIEYIGESEVKGLRKLQVLNLRNNKISLLDHQVLECLPRLRHLYLEGNPWNCTCKLLMVKRFLIDKGTDIKGGQCAEPSISRGESWMSSDTILRHCENTFSKSKENKKKLKIDEFSNTKKQIEDENDDDYDYDIE
ncbi:nephrocan-like [Pelobates cultripes]|uniref:Nephrocan-like n=1 Tax=Pelobates cultripes TaxID=61616 RepID=A0AAD1VT41_PELCU|nr:nephrocan-like [Pelobates cultripes]